MTTTTTALVRWATAGSVLVGTLGVAAPAGAATTDDVSFTTLASCEAQVGGSVIGGAWFRGEARVRGTYTASTDTMRAEVTEYRITKVLGTGGNKANVNIDQGGNWAYSADAMRQDGEWHPLDLAVTGKGDWGRVQFVFDLSGGADPRCTGSYSVP